MRPDKPATRVIALEEAFLHPRLWELFPPALHERYALVRDGLDDVGPGRIRRMDAAGIDMQVLSHVQPGVQFIGDSDTAVRVSKEVNDWLAEVVRTYPTRFAGFAMLPTQAPEAAADELERTVAQLGFKGALINGHTHGRYLDDASFSVLLERAQALDVPIYIHPSEPPQAVTDAYYRDNPSMVIGWGWAVDTGTHVLRLVCGGVFDRYPRLKIIIGHMGELLPYCLTRLNLMTLGDWMLAAQEAKARGSAPRTRRAGMQRSVHYYMRQNVFVTSSGVFDQPVFECAAAMLGIDNLLFSVDDPLRDNFEAVEFLRAARLSEADKEKFAHGNAERLLKLRPATGARTDLTPSPAEHLGASLFAFRAKAKSKLGRALVSFFLK
jgi:predicted TIM-barrel fold metal-dependent hydrolase